MTDQLPDDLAARFPRYFPLIEKHGGQFFTPIPRPPGLRKRLDKACWRNAYNVAAADKSLSYAEGLALHDLDGLEFWVEHAWNVNDAGEAIDTTWKVPGVCYFGVTVPLKVVAGIIVDVNLYGPVLEHL